MHSSKSPPQTSNTSERPSDDEALGRPQTRLSSPHPRMALRRAALSEGNERDRYMRAHPLRQKCKILTESMKDAYLIVNEALIYRRPGVCFYGPSRSGKSTAAQRIYEMLSQEILDVAFAIVTAQSHEAPTERMIWGDILNAFQLDNSGTAETRKQTIRSGIIAACAARRARHFCLIIDEMQNWGEKELTWVRDLTNILDLHDKHNWTTVGWGDRKLLEVSSSLRVKRQDLWGRFLKLPTPFQGIRNVEHLAFFMGEHDNPERCEYPVGSGICYTEFFLPQAFDSGWRLGMETQNAWGAFERAASKVGKVVDGLGMEWAAPAIRDFLVEKAAYDCPHFVSTEHDWDQAIASAGYVDSFTD